MMEKMSDASIMAQALNMWANYVETGTVTLSAKEAQERYERAKNDRFRRADIAPPRALDEDQMRLVMRLRNLAVAQLKADSVVFNNELERQQPASTEPVRKPTF